MSSRAVSSHPHGIVRNFFTSVDEKGGISMLSLGERLKNARESRGWTQDQLADRINVTRYTISNWERDVSEPCFHELQRLSALFSCNFLADCDENAVNQEEISRKFRLNPCKQPVIEVISGENACDFREITVDCHVTGVDQQGNAINFRFIAPFSIEKTEK